MNQNKETRRIVQIATHRETLFALCNDGSIFLYAAGFEGSEARWNRWLLPLIPQENEDETK